MKVENNTRTTKHKPPSRIRYEESNPVFSIRMPQAWHDKLITLLQKTGRTRKTFMAIALSELEANHEQAYKQGYNKGNEKRYQDGFSEGKQEGLNQGFATGEAFAREEGFKRGYAEGKKDWAICVYCKRCTKELFIKPLSTEHTYIIENMMGVFCHQRCPKY